MVCVVEKCGKPLKSAIYCQSHYDRMRRRGTLEPVAGREIHGLSGTPLHRLWKSIKTRCYNPKAAHYADYGGRGIKLHPSWQTSFTCFHDDILTEIGPKPTSHHSLNRKNNDKNYQPGNVEWATQSEQTNNTRRNHMITAHGRTQTMMQWSREIGIDYRTLRSRLRYGWTAEKALSFRI